MQTGRRYDRGPRYTGLMRSPVDLPADLRAALEKIAHGKSRRAIGVHVAEQSGHYRSGGRSDLIASEDDALAYAFTRLPATYAAAIAVFDAVRETCPAFAPRTLIDVGAGPGSATFAALEAFPAIERLDLIDANPRMRALALALFAQVDDTARRRCSYRLSNGVPTR